MDQIGPNVKRTEQITDRSMIPGQNATCPIFSHDTCT